MNKHGVLSLVSRIEGGPYYTYAQVAERVGKSKDTIIRWVNEGSVPPPTHRVNLGEEGKSFAWLFTEEDIEIIEAYSYIVRPGRPKKRR